MKPTQLLPILLLLLGSWTSTAQAQLFGDRELGGTSILSKYQKSANPTAPAGSARFVRGNRAKDDFVGTGSKQNRTFVGREQASPVEQVRPALDNLKVEANPTANTTAAPATARRGMYNPRLAVGFDFVRPQETLLSSDLQKRLAASPSIQWTGPCAVSWEGRTATLQGTVASARDRELAERLALFEPGISQVQNELRVVPPPPTPGLNPPGPDATTSPAPR